MDEISYPSERMATTAGTLRTTLDEAWGQHNSILNNSILEPATRLGDKVSNPFHSDVTTWSQNMRQCYDALYELANALNTGAIVMPEQDQVIAAGFQHEGE
jgi:uncharacterized protein YukE